MSLLQSEVGAESPVVEVKLVEGRHSLLDIRRGLTVEDLQVQSYLWAADAFRYEPALLKYFHCQCVGAARSPAAF